MGGGGGLGVSLLGEKWCRRFGDRARIRIRERACFCPGYGACLPLGNNVSLLDNLHFEPSQPLGIISGLKVS